jgi:hypothetical protein
MTQKTQKPQMKNKSYFIEKNIPMPEQRYAKYPFSVMEIGDSFFAETKASSLLTTANYFLKKHNKNWEFTVRKENNGTRIWRTK